MRVGILGGTFNPPHVGHLVCAQEAYVGLGLERVLLAPVREPPHKAIEADPGCEHRIRLCELAVAGDERFAVSRVDADRPGPSWTVDTLRKLHADAPEHDLTFIVGGDMAYSLPTWREPEAVLELAELGVAERVGVGRPDVAEALSPLPGALSRVRFFEMPRIDVSSSYIRRQVASGRPVRYLVPEAVADYMRVHELYVRSGAAA